MPLNTRFLKREHLRFRRDFERALGGKCRAADALLVIYVARNDLGFSRIGISVNKRIGNAVRRHDVQRRIREAFRKSKADLPGGLDIVCVARPSAADKRTKLANSLLTLVARASARLNARVQPPGLDPRT